MRALERYMLLQIIDERWREHLHDMDYLREGIHLRGFAQIEPLVAYKNEGFEMFTGLMNSIWEEFARYIFNVEVEVEGQNGGRPPQWPAGAAAPNTSSHVGLHYAGGTAEDQPSALAAARGRRRARRDRRTRPTTPARTSRCRCIVETRRSTRRSASAATTRAGAARARSSRSATAPSAGGLRDQLKLLADYL